MNDAHQPQVTTVTSIAGSLIQQLELAEKELKRAQEAVVKWQETVDSLRKAINTIQAKSSFTAKPRKQIELAISFYRTKGSETHISEMRDALNLTEKEMRNLSTQLGTKARNKTIFYKVKGKKATYGLLE